MIKPVWRLAAAVTVCVIAGLAWLQFAAPACSALDRLFGGASCVAKMTIPDIRPMPFHTMVQAPDGTIRLFGYSGEKPPFAPVQLSLDIEGGAERDRKLLPFTRVLYRMNAAPDMTSAAITCLTGNICDTLNPQGYVIDAASGKILYDIKTADGAERAFPGDTRPAIGLDAAHLPDAIAAYPDPDTGGIALMKMPDRTEIDRLVPDSPQKGLSNPSMLAVRTSPSGRYAVVINRAVSDIGTRLDIWDMKERKMLRRIETPTNLRIATSAIWLRDERHLAALRDLSTDDAPDAGIELYVFKLME